ncbi:MAG TPA: aminotransferase class III-fold pyridoxal phosphate-dependent enzyme, partial [Candidatus Limnocylindria bacterium]|nr:aminotransferase class III-fold pyridoxal phosphate-dependent enzyme [Candidatus Limnocylindria bacterium]
IVADVLDRFEEVVSPLWPSLRAQAVHGDLTLDNVLLDERGFISGIIDFGDMSHSALAADLAPVLDSLAVGRNGAELYRAARLLLDGYQRITPLEPVELELLGDLWAARCAVTVAISSWRSARGLEDADFAERYNPVSQATLETFLATGWQALPAELGGAEERAPDVELATRRSRVLGPALEPLSYGEPIHLASARGVWMTDVEGVTYLDAYNNVPCVGHAHPRVTEAIARQARVLNTNMRYLHASAIELAERLVAECDAGLDTVMFVNSGSEANDLAWRMAVAFTGNTGGLCTDFAYHGISEPIAALSPESWGADGKPAHVETWIPQDHYRGDHLGTEDFAAALENLSLRGLAPAAVILDGVVTSDGFRDLDATYVEALVRMTHQAGGLWIADEVQGGHGRTGDAMWSYQRTGIQPDFVTLGKPMGNGHPVAAVITRREIAEQFARGTVFFSTFGGNPVSVAAAHAVLDVLADELVLPRTQAAGEALRSAVRELQEAYPVIGDVRGMGLANGIELVTDAATKEPDPDLAAAVKEGMRDRRVLVGTCGRQGNVLKVRPPLAFTVAEVPQFVDALSGSLVEAVGG